MLKDFAQSLRDPAFWAYSTWRGIVPLPPSARAWGFVLPIFLSLWANGVVRIHILRITI